MSLGIFITGTDTGVGKTLISATLARCVQTQGIRIGVMKPIETGVDSSNADASDAHRLHDAAGFSQPFDTVRQYSFPDPIAPLAAASRQGTVIDLNLIDNHYRTLIQSYERVLVEGVGGAMVPLTSQGLVRDLIKMLAIPTLIVGTPKLGSVNQMLLTLEALQSYDIRVVGIVLNHDTPAKSSDVESLQHSSSVALIRELSGVPVFGPISYEETFKHDWNEGIDILQHHPSIQDLAHLITQMPT